MNTVYVKSYKPKEPCRREILRYAGAPCDLGISEMLDACLSELEGRLSFKACYGEFPVALCDGYLDFGFMKVSSNALKKRLEGCKSAVIFAATVGIEIDRLVKRYTPLSEAKALIINAIGIERVEALCDAFCEDIEEKMQKLGLTTTARFSPGYADLSIEHQREIFRALDCYKKIGVSLNESLLMSPTKSVTAIIGVKEK